jgi:hypothetical protein
MDVSNPVMIMSLEDGAGEHELFTDEAFDIIVPLPRLESCSMYMQGAKADETRYNLRCNLYECLRGKV